MQDFFQFREPIESSHRCSPVAADKNKAGMTESYRDGPCDHQRLQAIGSPASLDAQNTIRKFPVGAHLTPSLFGHDDLLLSGWVGLGRPRSPASSLIGVLL